MSTVSLEWKVSGDTLRSETNCTSKTDCQNKNFSLEITCIYKGKKFTTTHADCHPAFRKCLCGHTYYKDGMIKILGLKKYVYADDLIKDNGKTNNTSIESNKNVNKTP